MRRGAYVAALSLLVAAQSLGAQARTDTTTRRDSLARIDSLLRRAGRPGILPDTGTQPRELIVWAPPDSVITALTSRTGYSVTRYQGDTVIFRAKERLLRLKRSDSAQTGVERDGATLVGDSILFNDSTQVITAWGDTLRLRDPAQGPDDLIAHGRIEYDVTNRRGLVTNVTTTVESGQRWIVHGDEAAFVNDTSAAARNTIYARHGWITSCTETVPHYHFAASEMKVVAGRILVARPAILYIADVPVLWLPFVFTDLRRGRRSGIIAPRIGFSDVVRNSPAYRRTIENLGYYFAINDYLDAEFTMDWRSNARAAENDPGWIRGNTVFRYNWLNNFLRGDIAYAYHSLKNGTRNQQVTWNHAQTYSQRTGLTLSFNWAENTSVQRQATFNPVVALGTIASRGSFNTARGPFSLTLGAGQTQYPGRDAIDRNFPTLSITSKPIELGEWLTWTPSFNFSSSQGLHLDTPSDFAFRFIQKPGGGIDSVPLDRSQRSSSLDFSTPLEIFGFQLQNRFRIQDQLSDFPSRREIYDIGSGEVIDTRVFARTFMTSVDFETSFALPTFLQGTWNLSPAVNIANVDAGGFFVRTERTGGKFVRQNKRLSYGLSAAPTVYRRFGGFGPIEGIRHQVQLQSSYRYSPRADVSDEYLEALGRSRKGYLGSLPQNAVSLGVSTVFEAKLRSRADTGDLTGINARKLKLLSLRFSPLEWDFERASATGNTGLTTNSFNVSASTDLLPGFDFALDYSLFQGETVSDTAVFKPYRTGLSAAVQLDARSPIVVGLARLLGIRIDTVRPVPPQSERGPSSESQFNQQSRFAADQPFTGSVSRAAPVGAIPPGRGWTASLRYSSNRQRPVSGRTVVDYDPRSRCEQFRLTSPILHNQCLLEVGAAQPTDPFLTQPPIGGTFFRIPAQENMQGSLTFHVTDKWAAQWSTTYDFVAQDFASHIVSLQRELHDWDAVFAFTKSPNGNFAFNFFIQLKAQPDIKFDYNRNTLPRGITGEPRQ
ncbi:MAG: putative LPS assembly protein LptD [Gemmatimonadaceae bacterium]